MRAAQYWFLLSESIVFKNRIIGRLEFGMLRQKLRQFVRD